MTGPATHASNPDVAAAARAALDRAAGVIGSMDQIQRDVIAALVGLWPTSAWLAAGATSPKAWLMAYAGQGYRDAARLERIAELCAHHPAIADAVADGTLALDQADRWARTVTAERARFLTDVAIDALLSLADRDDEAFDDALRYWRDRVDEQIKPARVQRHSVTMSRRLFGGGDILASLAPAAFETVCTAIDAFTTEPDPADAPYQRTLSERRADGLDDLATFGLTHDADHADNGDADEDLDDVDDHDPNDVGDDLFDGLYDDDELDVRLDPVNAGLDDLDLFRVRLRKAIAQQRRRAARRVRARSGVTVNVHLDLRTLAGLRDENDLEDLISRGEGWSLAQRAAEQMLCDASLVATLFAGPTRILDANTSAEQFSKRQRRALAARDRHCCFPGCRRQPKHCDAHHLDERANGGPTIVANGCLLCRFHHRLLHQHGWKLYRGRDDRWTALDPHGVEWKGRRITRPAAA